MEAAGWRDFLERGADVSLKVNLGWDLFVPGSVTSPWVLDGVIEVIKGHVGKIYVVESDQVLVNCEKALAQTGVAEVIRKHGATWQNMSKCSFEEIAVPKPRVLERVRVPEILQRTNIVTIPVMKTHDKTTITGALKNQWGCLPKMRHSYHPVVDDAIADINQVVRPVFAVTDGTVGLEGDGPKSGIPKVMDLVLASGDPVAIDSVQAKIMGFDPAEIPHITNCAEIGLGVADAASIEIEGTQIEAAACAFRPARRNVVSRWEMGFRQSWLRKLVFDTPLFWLCCRGAIVWYLLWYYLGPGRRRVREILRHPRYGRQWRASR